ncbi:MAG: DUF3784 domain-containing protein [Bacteroidales bacterium]|nr:DUF3784 domain-containing protein [Bacteroidales bacterium]
MLLCQEADDRQGRVQGRNLIAGYNTASKDERPQYNVKRLRGLIGDFLLILAPIIG